MTAKKQTSAKEEVLRGATPTSPYALSKPLQYACERRRREWLFGSPHPVRLNPERQKALGSFTCLNDRKRPVEGLKM